MGRWGDGEMGRWEPTPNPSQEGEMGRWGDGEMGRWGVWEVWEFSGEFLPNSNLLPITYYLLPITYYLLPITSCLLPFLKGVCSQ
ncbi:hypothetical protein [Moorena sp. SIO4G3]|uniref:hypothetical protein n=1 Tax=Moorena sp. SIO4G3 TaxID=2607821 RepID=UPI0025D4A4A0|nr:hypothetical protein [Moorena sp. SIO4G3]